MGVGRGGVHLARARRDVTRGRASVEVVLVELLDEAGAAPGGGARGAGRRGGGRGGRGDAAAARRPAPAQVPLPVPAAHRARRRHLAGQTRHRHSSTFLNASLSLVTKYVHNQGISG